MKSLQQTEEATLKILRSAGERAAEKHRRMGVQMVVWKNERIAEIIPKSIKSRKKSGKATAPAQDYSQAEVFADGQPEHVTRPQIGFSA